MSVINQAGDHSSVMENEMDSSSVGEKTKTHFSSLLTR